MRPLTIYPNTPARFGVQAIPLAGDRTLVWESPTGTQIEIKANNLTFNPTANRTVTLPNGVASADGTTSTDGTVLRLGVSDGNAYAVTFVSVAGAVIGRVTDGVYLDVRWDASGAPTALASGSDPASTTVSFPGFAGRYLLLNDSYSSDTALAAGIVMNVDPTTTQTTTAGYGVFTPGVVSVSNPSLTVASISGFSAGDLVLISGSASNDGLYELQAASGQTLAFRSTLFGLSSQVEDFTKNQFVSATEASSSVKVTKVSVTVLRAGADGLMEMGSGSATGITFRDIADNVANTDVQIPFWIGNYIAVSGTWALTRVAAADVKLRRSATAALEVAEVFLAGFRLRTTTGKGLKLTGLKIKYSVGTADLATNGVDVAVNYALMPANAANVAAATALAFTWDSNHDTAAKRKTQGEHTATITFSTPIYFNQDVALMGAVFSIDGSASGVFDLRQIIGLATEAVVD